jgi:hypothetical protein
MHLLIPYAAALSEAARHVQRDLGLPVLSKLLARMELGAIDDADEYSLSPPHERALASAWGWQGGDGAWPFAARAAAADGIAVGDLAWGLLTPAHWQVGRDSVSLTDPDLLALDAAESRTLLEAIGPLFESEGVTLAWGAPTRWYAAHDSLDGLPTASLDRAIGRNIDLWMRSGQTTAPQASLFRRLQSEVQLMLYPHPVNEAREERGAPTVNSFWLSGCGRHQASDPAAVAIDERLRMPLLAGDWAGWADVWRAIDGGPIAELLARADQAQPAVLTLCGERHAQRFDAVPRSWWQRLAPRRVDVAAVLEAL